VRTDNFTLVMLVVLPLVATISLGFLVGRLIDSGSGGRSWPVWLIVLVLSCGVWWLYFSERL
jgi:hypothetical protein